MADNPAVIDLRQINNSSLSSAYSFILSTLQRDNLRATAAFVTCFAVETETLRDKLPLIQQIAEHCPGWFHRVIPALKCGKLDGWTGDEFYQAMAAAGFEMAWHGATHLPLLEETPVEAVALEVELASQLFGLLGSTPNTIVFPRNQIGHLRTLHGHGFTAYRAGYSDSRLQKASRLLNEYNIFDRRNTQKPILRDSWCVFPAGDFLNWPAGVRKLVPVSTTVKRWKSMLRSAADSGGYVHMWFHPHNLITAPSMKLAFEEIMSFVGELVKYGHLLCRTIDQDCK